MKRFSILKVKRPLVALAAGTLLTFGSVGGALAQAAPEDASCLAEDLSQVAVAHPGSVGETLSFTGTYAPRAAGEGAWLLPQHGELISPTVLC